MTKTITLEAIDPIEIYGAGNKILEYLCSYYPELKVIARGNEIKLEGEESQIEDFNEKIQLLIRKRMRKMSLNPYDVEDLFDTEAAPERFDVDPNSVIVYGNDGKPIKPRNHTQQEMIKAYLENDLVFAVGPAGTGKTYVAIALAVRALKNREVKRIVLTRPAVEAGERLGFLPGDLKDKLDPYLQPLYDALGDMIPPKKLQELLEEGSIQIAPLAYMRGRTLEKSFVILDEAQNTNIGQLKMFLTRMGQNSKFIVTGDASQVDLPNKNESGLLKGIAWTKNIKGIKAITFRNEDIVRHPLVSKIVRAFDRKEHEEETASKEE